MRPHSPQEPQARRALPAWAMIAIAIAGFMACEGLAWSADAGFYDGDNSCSLGCGCAWDISRPATATVYRARHPRKPRHDDDIVFDHALMIRAGDAIGFRLHDVANGGIDFCGFSIDGGSCDGKADCTLPKTVEVLVNGKPVQEAVLKRTRERQTIALGRGILVRNGDAVALQVKDGYVASKAIGVTYLVPNGGH